jgi:hypothetical protein
MFTGRAKPGIRKLEEENKFGTYILPKFQDFNIYRSLKSHAVFLVSQFTLFWVFCFLFLSWCDEGNVVLGIELKASQ